MTAFEFSPQTRRVLVILGKILIAALFLTSGYGKIKGWPNLVTTLGGKGFPVPMAFAVATIAVEILGTLALFVPRLEQIGALALLATFFFHAFWMMPPEAVASNTVHFLKDLAIVGGLLVIGAVSPGRLDRRT